MNGCKRIQELIRKYGMQPHEENGCYAEQHFPYAGDGRAPSGSSYFYVPAGESTQFHRIDCDEYWCYHGGDCLEVWIIDPTGHLEVKKLGLGEDAEPMLYFPQGSIFGSRNLSMAGEGTFFTCITVPRFSYEGFELVDQEEVIRLCPETKAFW